MEEREKYMEEETEEEEEEEVLPKAKETCLSTGDSPDVPCWLQSSLITVPQSERLRAAPCPAPTLVLLTQASHYFLTSDEIK